MGLCTSCCGKVTEETYPIQASPETRRQQQLEAAERRRQENERRGIHNPDSVRRKMERQQRLANQQETQGGDTLRWQVN